jgi:hypothetical protein
MRHLERSRCPLTDRGPGQGRRPARRCVCLVETQVERLGIERRSPALHAALSGTIDHEPLLGLEDAVDQLRERRSATGGGDAEFVQTSGDGGSEDGCVLKVECLEGLEKVVETAQA